MQYLQRRVNSSRAKLPRQTNPAAPTPQMPRRQPRSRPHSPASCSVQPPTLSRQPSPASARALPRAGRSSSSAWGLPSGRIAQPGSPCAIASGCTALPRGRGHRTSVASCRDRAPSASVATRARRQSHPRKTARRNPQCGRTSGSPDGPPWPQNTAASPASARPRRLWPSPLPPRPSVCLSRLSPKSLAPPEWPEYRTCPSSSQRSPLLLVDCLDQQQNSTNADQRPAVNDLQECVPLECCGSRPRPSFRSPAARPRKQRDQVVKMRHQAVSKVPPASSPPSRPLLAGKK